MSADLNDCYQSLSRWATLPFYLFMVFFFQEKPIIHSCDSEISVPRSKTSLEWSTLDKRNVQVFAESQKKKESKSSSDISLVCNIVRGDIIAQTYFCLETACAKFLPYKLCFRFLTFLRHKFLRFYS